ncbi:hypothetical protein RAH32_11310 [Paracoccus sp. WLY502]|uniref:DUF6635 family protein n=1 Tax=Paracoccus yibinensis TaxID=3068891 RepID=UPI002796A28A|nr:DUF6635 family protein [Paracoccus sp. WLY502]MDQ1901031.1 hypothetical protein [Paracoccus sp. WLY502]
MPATLTDDALARRRAAVSRFVRDRYGPRGTLRLHRAALGWDLLRAPVNVMLSPVFLLTRLVGWALPRLGLRRAGAWLSARRVFLPSDMGRVIQTDLEALVADLDAQGIGPTAPLALTRQAAAAMAETRNAVSEITTSVIVLVSGWLLFNRATPGVISLAGPLAEMRAHSTAVSDFLLGDWLGRAWYWAFPVELSPWEVILTGVALAVIGSLVTTFAGLVADPVQVVTGTHRRRILRLLDRLDRAQPGPGLEREHLLARAGDLSDAAMMIWRNLR